MSNREEARKRTAMLKRLRTEHAHSVERTQALLKEQKQVQKLICRSIREKAKTVPEVAEEVNIPTHKALWHLTAYRKYDLVVEEGMCGEYVLYRQIQEK